MRSVMCRSILPVMLCCSEDQDAGSQQAMRIGPVVVCLTSAVWSVPLLWTERLVAMDLLL